MSAEAKITAYVTLNEEGDPAMLFFDRAEAVTYCEEGEEPIEMVPRAELDRLRAEAEGLRVDAERWQCLRKQCQKHADGLTIAAVDTWGLQAWSGDDPDRAIDAIRSLSGPKGQGGGHHG